MASMIRAEGLLDAVDWRALQELQRDGRMSASALAKRLGLSRPAVTDRVQRLENLGIIRGYTAVLAPKPLGVGLLSFVGVVLEHPRFRVPFLKLVQALPEVLECHHLTGDFDYLLKLRCRDTDALEHLVSHRLKGIRALARTRTMIVMASEKDGTPLPLDGVPVRARRRR